MPPHRCGRDEGQAGSGSEHIGENVPELKHEVSAEEELKRVKKGLKLFGSHGRFKVFY